MEISHEALADRVDEAAELDRRRTPDVRNQRRLAESMHEWHAADRDDAYLLRGGRLDQLPGWATMTSLPLSGPERAFLAASVAERIGRRGRCRTVSIGPSSWSAAR